MSDERIILTKEQAISVMVEGDLIHTFRSGANVLIGADWRREELIELFDKCEIEIGGDQCKATGHGLVVWTGLNNPLFIEADKTKLQALEDSIIKQLSA